MQWLSHTLNRGNYAVNLPISFIQQVFTVYATSGDTFGTRIVNVGAQINESLSSINLSVDSENGNSAFIFVIGI